MECGGGNHHRRNLYQHEQLSARPNLSEFGQFTLAGCGYYLARMESDCDQCRVAEYLFSGASCQVSVNY